MLVDETISARQLADHPPVRRKSGASGQGELEGGRWLVASVAVGAVGVLVGFWGFVAWLLYALFA